MATFKKILLFVAFIFSTKNINAQNHQAFTQKLAHNYRTIFAKFESDFIALGEGKGTCLPAVFIDTTIAWNKANTTQGLIKFGDVPVYQGFYLAVLATHLDIYSEEKEVILDKINFVLKSKNRLDECAEELLYNTKTFSQPNGFFIRDDIDLPTAQKLFKQPYVNSDLTNLESPLKNALSQDQIIGYLLGYTFIIKALKNKSSPKEKALFEMASEQMNTMLTYLKNNKWVVKDPVFDKMVERGPYAKFQAYPMASIAQQYIQKDLNTPMSVGLGKLGWKLSEWCFKIGRNLTFVDPFAKKLRYFIFDDINNSMILKLAAMSNTWQAKRLAEASELGNLEVYELINAYLFDRKPLIDAAKIEKILDGMTHKGAYFYSQQYKAPNGWASRDRWSHPGDRYAGSEFFKGNYPSLDFLLLCNLYQLTYQK